MSMVAKAVPLVAMSNPSSVDGSTPRAPTVNIWPLFAEGVPGGTFTPPIRTRTLLLLLASPESMA
jgi:hypothetical protein